MQAEHTYVGIYRNGRLETEPPMPTGREVRVAVTILEGAPELEPPKRPFRFDDPAFLRLREALSPVHNLSDEIEQGRAQ